MVRLLSGILFPSVVSGVQSSIVDHTLCRIIAGIPQIVTFLLIRLLDTSVFHFNWAGCPRDEDWYASPCGEELGVTRVGSACLSKARGVV